MHTFGGCFSIADVRETMQRWTDGRWLISHNDVENERNRIPRERRRTRTRGPTDRRMDAKANIMKK